MGKWLSGILSVVFIGFFIAVVFEDAFFFNSDVRKKLKEHDFELHDNFRILSNESGGFTDYYHRFEIEISPLDKERIIRQITSAENFQKVTNENFDFLEGKEKYSDIEIFYTANRQDNFYYIFEYYKPTKLGHSPIWDIISVSKSENKLIYERILD